MQAEPCTDWGTTSFLMGAITGMVAAWIVAIYLAVVKGER